MGWGHWGGGGGGGIANLKSAHVEDLVICVCECKLYTEAAALFKTTHAN